MSRMEIREARVDDWPAVAGLLAELGRPDVRGGPDEATHRQRYESYLARENAVALVAELDGRVVGFLDMEFRERLSFVRPQAWIPDLVVTEAARSRGIGRALLARAEELARERDCFAVSLESASWRTRSHAFYERAGWPETAKSFSKNLTGEQWPPAPRP